MLAVGNKAGAQGLGRGGTGGFQVQFNVELVALLPVQPEIQVALGGARAPHGGHRLGAVVRDGKIAAAHPVYPHLGDFQLNIRGAGEGCFYKVIGCVGRGGAEIQLLQFHDRVPPKK